MPGSDDDAELEFRALLEAKPAVRLGVLHFSYAYSSFEQAIVRDGHVSINLGDFMQTLAVRHLYEKLGVPADRVKEIDRDSLRDYSGGPIMVIMNGCFFRRSFPIPTNVIPVFIGFQAKEPIIEEFKGYLKQHEPIGCRDVDTHKRCQKHGIASFVTGCSTLAFDTRSSSPARRKILVVYGSGAGDFPAEVLATAPAEYLADMEFIFQRQIVHSCPMTPGGMHASERYTRSLLDYYRSEASLVVTPLHHAAAPCMSSGIPVVLCRKQRDSRFSFLKELIDVHVAPDFSGVDWDPPAVDLTAVRESILSATRDALMAAFGRLA